MRTAVVVGYGSIGKRYARLLIELSLDVVIVSRRSLDGIRSLSSIAAALDAVRPELVVIANETSLHMTALEQLAKLGFHGAVLVEKPLSTEAIALPPNCFCRAAVAYNLRFHPVLRALQDALVGEQLIAAHVYCGQYLPDWRPEVDYRASYSARRDLGGGVLRDLSHELDYMRLLFGPFRNLAAIGGRLGTLAIDTDDCWAVLGEHERCPIATLQVNYLDRPGRRDVLVITGRHTFRADFRAGSLEIDGNTERFATTADDSYRAQLDAILGGDTARLCSLADGAALLDTIAAIEQAASSKAWVKAA